MYNYIRGEITAKGVDGITVEAGGVGYAINPTASLCDRVSVGDVTIVHVYFVVKEDSHMLYGFADVRERALFMQLMSVSGVGAKTALAMLSLGCDALSGSIAAGDVGFISSVKGVSRKTAEKVIVDLRDKVMAGAYAGGMFIGTVPTSAEGDAVAALVGLGLTKNTAAEIVKGLDTAGKSAEEIVVAALAKR
jgi:Holliday junction DNA helicase RuvA